MQPTKRKQVCFRIEPEVWENCKRVSEQFDVNWSRMVEDTFKSVLAVYNHALSLSDDPEVEDVCVPPLSLVPVSTVYSPLEDEGDGSTIHHHCLVRYKKLSKKQRYYYIPAFNPNLVGNGFTKGLESWERISVHNLERLIHSDIVDPSVLDRAISEEDYFAMIRDEQRDDSVLHECDL